MLARDKGADGADYSLPVLTVPTGFAGIEGIFRFLPSGLVDRGLAVIEVRREGPLAISPARDSFETPAN